MRRAPGGRVIAFATWLLALLGAGVMYVSFDAQYQFILAQKGARAASLIEAATLDAGMVILSALGIGLARAGKPSGSVRVLIMICAGASAGMNLAAADSASWRSVAAYVAAPVFLAVITDRVITVIRQHVLPFDAESAWAPLGRAAVAVLRLAGVVALYLLRAVLAPSGTLRGLRQMVLDAAPVPMVTNVRRADGEPVPCPARDHEISQHGSGRHAPRFPPVPTAGVQVSPGLGSAPKRQLFCRATRLTRSTGTGQRPGGSPPNSPRWRACRPEPGVPTLPRSCASSPARPGRGRPGRCD